MTCLFHQRFHLVAHKPEQQPIPSCVCFSIAHNQSIAPISESFNNNQSGESPKNIASSNYIVRASACCPAQKLQTISLCDQPKVCDQWSHPV